MPLDETVSLQAGVAIFNAGAYHAAHDAWEEPWLALERGTDDERFFHGLIQYTAAIHHATESNVEGATGLADSAREYLASVPGTYRAVALVPVRHVLAALAVDPTVVERHTLPPLIHAGSALTYGMLDRPAMMTAARAIAEADERWAEETVDRAAAFAESRERGNRFETLLADFVREPEDRGLIYRRLEGHLDREETKSADVEGLFDDA